MGTLSKAVKMLPVTKNYASARDCSEVEIDFSAHYLAKSKDGNRDDWFIRYEGAVSYDSSTGLVR